MLRVVALALLPVGLVAAGAQDWWAYRPLQKVTPPDVAGAFVRNDIDRFVLARLRERGLEPAPPADRGTLIRRATYDLTGLPPSPEEVEAFVADPRPDAWERLIDRLLASEQYGVHQARHWLDLVRYAETDSFERDRRKPGAWRYRDWVVDSLNADKPYDRFLVEQLAGDEVKAPSYETLVATGYLHLGIRDDEPTDTLQAVYDDLDGMLDTTARVMLGMSMGCARCHDHKRDPIPQRDYYRMLAFFEGLKPYKVGGGNHINTDHFVRLVEVDAEENARQRAVVKARRKALLAQARALGAAAMARSGIGLMEMMAAERDGGLVAYLPFDAGVAPTCRIEGGTPGRGVVGGGLELDGIDDGATLARPVQGDFTLALWFRADDPGRGTARDPRWFLGSGLIDGEVAGVVDDFGLSLVADRVAAGTGNPETFLSSDIGHADGAWHHVAFTREMARGRVALYVDGWLVDESDKASRRPLDSALQLAIGRMLPGHGRLRGAVDEVRIYDRALSARDVLSLMLNGGLEEVVSDAIGEHVGSETKERFQRIVGEITALRLPRRELAEVMAAVERADIPPGHVRRRGNVHLEGEQVQPGFPQVLGGGDATCVPRPGSSGRRSALAAWIVARDNPLTWRVAANRLWHYHFGRGIVRTPNDFGRLGERPTHPALLDWLASAFIAQGFSLKAMHRLVMTSGTYRMASRAKDAIAARAAELDPRNDLLWHFDRRRLDAEEIRDSMLAVSGALRLETGGPSVYPPMPAEVLATSSRPDEAWGRSPPDQVNRRSLYIHVKRSLLTPLLVAFDMADTDSSCPVRFRTTQPTQALTTLNSAFAQEQAALFAARLRREADSTRARVVRGLWLVAGRPPSDADVEEGVAMITEMQAEFGLSADVALRRYCLLLLNLNAFVYVD